MRWPLHFRGLRRPAFSLRWFSSEVVVPPLEAIQSKYRSQQAPEADKTHFLEVLRNAGQDSEEDELEAEADEVDFSDDDEPASRTMEQQAKTDDPSLEVRESRYNYIDWNRLRVTIVNECVEAMVKRTKETDLKQVLARWDGMVGNQLVAAVMNRLTSSEEAFAFFKWAGQQYNYNHDALSYSALVKVLVNVDKDHRKAAVVFKHSQRALVRPDATLMELLIQGFCNAGEIDEAVEYLGTMWKEVGAVTPAAFVSILNAMFKAGKVEEACSFFSEQMPRYQCRPDCITFNAVLNGLCGAGKMEKAVQVFEEMSIEKIGHTYSTIIDGFCQQNELEQALKYADLMVEAGHPFHAFTYNALIGALGRAGRVAEAYSYYEKMVFEKCSPNRKVYFSTVRALCLEGEDLSRLEQARSVMEAGIRDHHTPYADVFYDFVVKACKAGKEEWIQGLFNEVAEKCCYLDNRECCDFLSRLSTGGKLDLALSFCRMMNSKDRAPDSATMNVLLRELCRSDKASQAFELLAGIDKMEAVKYEAETYSGLLGELCRAGKVDEAFSLYGMMVKHAFPIEASLLELLLRGFCEKGKASMGLRIYNAMTKKGLYPDAGTTKLLHEELAKLR